MGQKNLQEAELFDVPRESYRLSKRERRAVVAALHIALYKDAPALTTEEYIHAATALGKLRIRKRRLKPGAIYQPTQSNNQ